ncbi:MAG TPA: hypothetical protein VGC72_12750, partial [Candidatus Elarobacter sp.]
MANIGSDIPQYCRRCGTMLIDGVCPTCPAPAEHPGAQPASAASTTPARIAQAASPASARHAVHQQRPAQATSQRPWFASTATPAPAERGAG